MKNVDLKLSSRLKRFINEAIDAAMHYASELQYSDIGHPYYNKRIRFARLEYHRTLRCVVHLLQELRELENNEKLG